MASTSIQPRGTAFARAAIALMVTKNWADTLDFAEARWPGNSAIHGYARKCAVVAKQYGTLDIDIWGELSDSAAAEFLDGVAQQSILGRLAGLVRVPSQTPFVTLDDATAHWVVEGQSIELSGGTMEHEALRPLRVSSFSAFPNELLRSKTGEAEQMVRRGLMRAIQHAVDLAFIDAANVGIERKRPASVTHDAPTVASTGDLAEDMAEALDLFAGHFDSTSVILHPRTAVLLGLGPLLRGPLDLGVKGGVLAGMPAICSEACDPDELVILDASAVALCDQGIVMHQSDSATVELDAEPTADAIAPTAASKKVVSLFTTESTGVIQTRAINWKLTRPGAVVRITGMVGSSGV